MRTRQTLARVGRHYWWPQQKTAVKWWVRSFRDCGSRKVKLRQVVPPLRSLGAGRLCERWALDLAGHLPITPRGNRYVVVAVEYLSRWVIAVPIKTKDADGIARVLLESVVFQFGPFKELLTDNASELVGSVVASLVTLLQAKQSVPVPYRPNLMGLAERFNRTWKDMVSMYLNESQTHARADGGAPAARKRPGRAAGPSVHAVGDVPDAADTAAGSDSDGSDDGRGRKLRRTRTGRYVRQ